MRISVIGCGRWGTCIAWYLNHIGHDVLLYGRKGSARLLALRETRSNGLLHLPDTLLLSDTLFDAAQAEIIVVSINAQGLRGLMEELSAFPLQGKTLVLCMKGIMEDTLERLSEVAAAKLPPGGSVAVWLGPGHVQEFSAGIPNCMVIDSESESTKHFLIDAFSSDLIRFYYGADLLGNEIGAAAKNVIGIAAGILDGLSLSTLKGALISRGAREISRLIEAMGGSPYSAYGLCHMGDYGATVFSPYSHNREYGEALAKGTPYQKLAEGAPTARALYRLGKHHGVDLPICNAVYRSIYENANARQEIEALFTRSQKPEFEGS